MARMTGQHCYVSREDIQDIQEEGCCTKGRVVLVDAADEGRFSQDEGRELFLDPWRVSLQKK